MPEKTPIDHKLIDRGRWLRDEIANPDSHLAWALKELADFEDQAKVNLLGTIPGIRPTTPLEYLSGRFHGLGVFRTILDDAITAGAQEAKRFAENRESGPLTQGDGPR